MMFNKSKANKKTAPVRTPIKIKIPVNDLLTGTSCIGEHRNIEPVGTLLSGIEFD